MKFGDNYFPSKNKIEQIIELINEYGLKYRDKKMRDAVEALLQDNRVWSMSAYELSVLTMLLVTKAGGSN